MTVSGAVSADHTPVAPEPFVPLSIMANRVVAYAIGVTLESLAAGNSAALEGHFRWIFAAAGLCFALSWLFLLAMEERPLRTGAAREGDPLAVPA